MMSGTASLAVGSPATATPVNPQDELNDGSADPLIRAVRACQFGELPLLESLIREKRVRLTDKDSEGVTLLHWAAINNRLHLVKWLLEEGAPPSAQV